MDKKKVTKKTVAKKAVKKTPKKVAKKVVKKAVKKTARKKAPKKSTTVKKVSKDTSMTLPAEFSTMESYISTHKTELMHTILKRMEYALKQDLDRVEVFKFTKSPFVVTLKEEDFSENLENIIEYYMTNEKYEHCADAFKLKKLLENKI